MGKTLKAFLIVVTFLLVVPTMVQAALLFEENFETNLSAWVGKYGGLHSGQIVADPTGATNNVLNFTALNSAGDIFTTGTFFSTTGNQYILEFDYFGTNNDSGGFIGYSDGLPGSGVFLAGSDTDYVGTTIWPNILIGDNYWHHYNIAFTTSGPIHLMLEDFIVADSYAGNAYFDNIILTDANGISAVPEPSTLLLLGSGLAGLGFWRIRKGKV